MNPYLIYLSGCLSGVGIYFMLLVFGLAGGIGGAF